jgi:hypothetical protein
VQSNKPVRIKPNTDYDVLIAVNNNNVTLVVEGVNWFTYDYAPRYDIAGDLIPMNAGMVGVGMDGSRGTFDNFKVQILAPEWTLNTTDDYQGPIDELTQVSQSGNWAEQNGQVAGLAQGSPTISLVDLGKQILANSYLELEVDITGNGGLVFDSYDAENYKFVVLDKTLSQLIIGHSTSRDGVVIDSTSNVLLLGGNSHSLQLTAQGAAMEIRVDGRQEWLEHSHQDVGTKTWRA